jgi:putative spermidine/putrescine transport system ATP-binding protein
LHRKAGIAAIPATQPSQMRCGRSPNPLNASSTGGIIDSVSFIGDRQRMVVSGASDKLLTVDAPNTVLAKAGERVGLLIAPDAVRLLPPES